MTQEQFEKIIDLLQRILNELGCVTGLLFTIAAILFYSSHCEQENTA